MTTEQVRIDPKIAAHVDAALAAGFTVYAEPGRDPRPVGHVYVCKKLDGPFALIQVPTHNFDPVVIDLPVEPHKDWGSGVVVDYDGTPEGGVAALTVACSTPMVTVRFMTRQYVAKHGTPRVPNHGSKVITKYGRSMDDVVKLGRRGTNWTVPQLAGRLEIGDRFEMRLEGRDHTDLTVTGRKYGGPDWDMVILTVKELAEPIELAQREFVTLLGAS
jgi:hypothetical protein